MNRLEQIADSLEGLRASLAGHIIDHRIEYLDDILEGLAATVDALRAHHCDLLSETDRELIREALLDYAVKMEDRRLEENRQIGWRARELAEKFPPRDDT